MFPARFEYRRAGSIAEAVSLLQEHGPEAKLLAGGQSLLAIMKLRLAQPRVLVDIGRLDELRGIERTNGSLTIGALATHTDVERSALLQRELPLLSEAAGQIGDRQVRNMGTWGGNLAHADPTSDPPAAVLALEGTLIATGRRGGRREIPVSDYFRGFFQTALAPDEMLTGIRFERLDRARAGWAYEKVPHPASRYAVVGVAAFLKVGSDGQLERVRVGVTGAGSHAQRARSLEAALEGHKPEESLLKEAAGLAPEGMELRSDLFASAEFRAHLLRVHTRRALKRALERALME